MKNIFAIKQALCCFAILVSISLKVDAFSSQLEKQNIDTVRLGKALIKNTTLYIAMKEEIEEEGDRVKAFKKGHEYSYNTSLIALGKLNILRWDIDSKNIYTAAIHESTSRGIYQIDKYPLETRDSLEYAEYVKAAYEKNSKLYKTEDEMYKAIIRYAQLSSLKHNSRSFSAVKHLYQAYFLLPRSREITTLLKSTFETEHFIDYNYLAIDSTKMEFYVKDKRQLTLWEYSYPEKNEEDKLSNWTEIRTWCVDTIRLPFDRKNGRVLPTIENTVYNAISDSTFLDHHFEIVKQGDNTFLINAVNGHMYWLTDKAVLKIGEVDIENQYKTLFGNTLFIEDRDSEELIFFSKVLFDEGEFERPKIKIINSEEEYKRILEYFN